MTASSFRSVTTAEKHCSKCGVLKPLDEFHRFANARDGHRAECKVCACARARDSYPRRYKHIAPVGQLTRTCAHCGVVFSYKRTTGQVRMYCGGMCKYRAGEQNKRARAAITQRLCACGSADVARVGRPVCPACKKDKRNTASAIERERRRTLRKYGITQEDWDRMRAEQNDRCAICGTDKPGGRGESWHIDHDHVDGFVRGLLCNTCNTGLGSFGDNPRLLAAAIAYLDRAAEARLVGVTPR